MFTLTDLLPLFFVEKQGVLTKESALTTNFTDRMSSIRDLKLNHYLELYTADLKVYSRLAHLKNINVLGF